MFVNAINIIRRTPLIFVASNLSKHCFELNSRPLYTNTYVWKQYMKFGVAYYIAQWLAYALPLYHTQPHNHNEKVLEIFGKHWMWVALYFQQYIYITINPSMRPPAGDDSITINLNDTDVCLESTHSAWFIESGDITNWECLQENSFTAQIYAFRFCAWFKWGFASLYDNVVVDSCGLFNTLLQENHSGTRERF